MAGELPSILQLRYIPRFLRCRLKEAQAQQLTEGSVNIRPDWSHDGKWIYFVSHWTGRNEVWKLPSVGGTAIQLTRNGGGDPIESEDGTAIDHQVSDDNPIRRAAARAASEGRHWTAAAKPNVDGVPIWASKFVLTREGIYYMTAVPDRQVRFLTSQAARRGRF